jgi:hypothetical protein
MAFLVGAWMWGIVSLGAQVIITQTPTTEGVDIPGYVLSCSDLQGTQKKRIGAAEGGGSRCLRELRSQPGISRQPGADLTEQAHREDS